MIIEGVHAAGVNDGVASVEILDAGLQGRVAYARGEWREQPAGADGPDVEAIAALMALRLPPAS